MEEKAERPRKHAFHQPWSGYLIATLLVTLINLTAYISVLALSPASLSAVASI
jgi:hypothetical protein